MVLEAPDTPKSLYSSILLPFQRHLGAAIISANAHLVEIDLSDNAFGPNGVVGLVDLLKSSSCYTLKELRLNNNGLGIGGGKVNILLISTSSPNGLG